MSTASGVNIKRFKDNIANFQELVRVHLPRRKTLHKQSPRYNYSHGHHGPAYTKGVKSDLVVVFESNSSTVEEESGMGFKRPIYDSVAFSFNRSADGSGLDIAASQRVNGKIVSSSAMSEEAFNAALKSMNKKLRSEGTPETLGGLFRLYRDSMIDNPDFGIARFDGDTLIDRIVGPKDQEKLGKLQSKYEDNQKLHRSFTDEIGRIDQMIDQETKTSAEYLEVQRLERELEAAKKRLGERKSRRYKEMKGSQVRKAAENAFSAMSSASREATALIQSIRQRAPKDPASTHAIEKWVDSNTKWKRI